MYQQYNIKSATFIGVCVCVCVYVCMKIYCPTFGFLVMFYLFNFNADWE
jgi:hypothetical protein